MKPEAIENYLEMNFCDIPTVGPMDRREFFKRLGGGILILFRLDVLLAQEGGRPPRGGFGSLPSDFNAYLRDRRGRPGDGLSGKIEMGQGAITSQAQMVAEELGVPLESSIWSWATPTLPVGHGHVRLADHPHVRSGAARRRRRGQGRVAAVGRRRPQVARRAAHGEDGVIRDPRPRHSVTYAQFAKGKQIERHLRERPR